MSSTSGNCEGFKYLGTVIDFKLNCSCNGLYLQESKSEIILAKETEIIFC